VLAVVTYDSYLEASARMDLAQAEAFLHMLADKSGGQAWFPRFEAAFPEVLQGVIQMLEHQYRLVYESQLPRDGKFHKIKVEAFRMEGDKRQSAGRACIQSSPVVGTPARAPAGSAGPFLFCLRHSSLWPTKRGS
jgi:hypothetical protein